MDKIVTVPYPVIKIWSPGTNAKKFVVMPTTIVFPEDTETVPGMGNAWGTYKKSGSYEVVVPPES
jgi:hypothetical protein